jgi:ubiquinol-cytochrome c reductase cytochrome b subunit
MENAVSASTAGSRNQIVAACAGYAGLHVALRLTAKLRNHPKVIVKQPAAGMWRLVRDALQRDTEDRWAGVFGRIAGYSFAVAVVTGVLLLPFFRPSMATVVYHGSYRLLDGVTMSQAYRSVLAISFDVRGGLLVRQVHHWSADMFVAAVCLRLLRVFFRGRFCGRALAGWLIWVALLPLGMFAAYTGTLLPDDGLSGGSLSVITGVLLSVPVIGTHLVFAIFGGAPPGHQIIGRDYWVHILVLPAVAGALLLASFGPSLRWPRRVGPDPLLPFTCAVLVLLATIAQINPVWLVGPYQPGSVSAGAVPDWYMGWLDGPLRLMPAWELSIAGHPLSLDVLIPGLVVPALFFTLLAAYPLLERRLTGDQGLHHVLDRPRDAATRTAVGAAGLTFYGVLWAAAANDQIAYHLQIDLYRVTWIFRVLVLAGPMLAFLITRGICHALASRRRDEELHGRETGRIVMNSQGGYTEIREPASPMRSARPAPREPLSARPRFPARRARNRLRHPQTKPLNYNAAGTSRRKELRHEDLPGWGERSDWAEPDPAARWRWARGRGHDRRCG